MVLDAWNRYKSEVHLPPLTLQEHLHRMTRDTLAQGASMVARQLSWDKGAAAYSDKEALHSLRFTARAKVRGIGVLDGKRDVNACAELACVMVVCRAQGARVAHYELIGSRLQLCILCGQGHQFSMQSRRVYEGQWCGQCRLKWNSETFATYCATRSCELLGKFENMGKTHKVKLKCRKCREVWEVRPKNFYFRWSGCPSSSCKRLIYEKWVRTMVEEMLGLRFPSTRPPWLRGLKGGQMQLDGLNLMACLALEVQGPQHYGGKTTTNGHELTDTKLEIQFKNDVIKTRRCFARGIFILEIPWRKNLVGERLRAFVRKCIEQEASQCAYAARRAYANGKPALGASFATASSHLSFALRERVLVPAGGS